MHSKNYSSHWVIIAFVLHQMCRHFRTADIMYIKSTGRATNSISQNPIKTYFTSDIPTWPGVTSHHMFQSRVKTPTRHHFILQLSVLRKELLPLFLLLPPAHKGPLSQRWLFTWITGIRSSIKLSELLTQLLSVSCLSGEDSKERLLLSFLFLRISPKGLR